MAKKHVIAILKQSELANWPSFKFHLSELSACFIEFHSIYNHFQFVFTLIYFLVLYSMTK
jgi:hypothetical protein